MIDKYYFITLTGNERRKKNVGGQILAHRLSNSIIWDAINTKGLNIKSTRGFTEGMIGCFLSHIQIWKEAIRNGYNYIMILEDDVSLVSDYNKKINEVLETLPEDFDFALLGNYLHQKNKVTYIENEHWYKCSNWHGTHCYLINLKSIKDKLSFFNNMTHQIDLQIKDLSNKNKLNTYLLKEPLARQIGLDTTVQKTLYNINNMY